MEEEYLEVRTSEVEKSGGKPAFRTASRLALSGIENSSSTGNTCSQEGWLAPLSLHAKNLAVSAFAFEELNCAFMFFGGRARVECSQVAAFPCLRIFLSRIKTIFAGFEFSDHLDVDAFLVCKWKLTASRSSRNMRASSFG